MRCTKAHDAWYAANDDLDRAEGSPVHGDQLAVRACTIAGTRCTVRGPRRISSCPLATKRWVNRSHSLITWKVGWYNVHDRWFGRSGCVAWAARRRVHSVESSVLVDLAAGRRRTSRGTSGRFRWSTKRFGLYNRSPTLMARLDRLDQTSASSGRNGLLHWRSCAAIWWHFAMLNKIPLAAVSI